MISIAMATYNGAKYLREQLDSLLVQTIQDFELIVCDDCSTDETISILQEYAEHDSRIYVFKNDVNIGFKRNFEKVVGLTHGDFIALCDQDDIWLPNHLEILRNTMRHGIQIVCGRPVFVNQLGEELPSKYNYLYMSTPPTTNEDIARHIFLCRNSYQGASMLIRREFFKIALPVPQGALFHDSWFAILACFTGGLLYLNVPTMKYRRHIESVTINDMRRPAFWMFASKLVHVIPKDRIVFVENIKQRVPQLSVVQQAFLDKMSEMVLRSSSFFGRIKNVPYLLTYFRCVFACDIKSACK